MRPYRVISPEPEVVQPPRRRGRAVAIVIAAVGMHAGLLGAAFMARAPEPVAPRTTVVPVLAGNVDDVGEFHATGLADARIRN